MPEAAEHTAPATKQKRGFAFPSAVTTLAIVTVLVWIAALRLLRNRARSAGKRLTVIDSHPSDRLASAPVPHERTAAPLPQLASDRPWASAPHAHGLGLPRAWSRIATPARRGGLTCGALFARAPMAGQARAVREATDAQ